MRQRGKILLAVFTAVLTAWSSAGPGATAEEAGETDAGVVTFEGVPYAGVFSEGEEDGTELFTVTEQDALLVSVEGEREGDGFEGEVQITLSDDTVIKATCKDGELSGIAWRTYPDGSVANWKYKDGFGTGRVIIRDADGDLSGVDRYYNHRRISEWESLAQEDSPDYAELMKNSEELSGVPVLFEGEVTDVLDNSDYRYLLVENEEGQTVICRYKNLGVSSQQALAQNVRAGDQVTVCGLFDTCTILSVSGMYSSCLFSDLDDELDLDDYVLESSVFVHGLASVDVQTEAVYSTLPVLDVVSVRVDGAEEIPFDQLETKKAKEYDYEQLLEAPYSYAGFLLSDTVLVRQVVIDYDNETARLLLQKQKGEGLYYAKMDLKDAETLPLVGDTLQIEAKLNGTYKLERRDTDTASNLDVVTWVLVPYLILNEAEVR